MQSHVKVLCPEPAKQVQRPMHLRRLLRKLLLANFEGANEPMKVVCVHTQ